MLALKIDFTLRNMAMRKHTHFIPFFEN